MATPFPGQASPDPHIGYPLRVISGIIKKQYSEEN
jgi:hypothetical protein